MAPEGCVVSCNRVPPELPSSLRCAAFAGHRSNSAPAAAAALQRPSPASAGHEECTGPVRHGQPCSKTAGLHSAAARASPVSLRWFFPAGRSCQAVRVPLCPAPSHGLVVPLDSPAGPARVPKSVPPCIGPLMAHGAPQLIPGLPLIPQVGQLGTLRAAWTAGRLSANVLPHNSCERFTINASRLQSSTSMSSTRSPRWPERLASRLRASSKLALLPCHHCTHDVAPVAASSIRCDSHGDAVGSGPGNRATPQTAGTAPWQLQVRPSDCCHGQAASSSAAGCCGLGWRAR
mmetsp:Transcript_54054/g.173329  ORF Transcript_54054/g.173329 Transcript_54054/m.173329 type:complete len:290 (+) Transcript_54054:282-1151(+)